MELLGFQTQNSIRSGSGIYYWDFKKYHLF